MMILRRPLVHVFAALVATVLACSLGTSLPGRSDVARAASAGQLQQQISQGQNQISNLSGAVHQASGHLAQLNANIASLQARLGRIQADLDQKRAGLLKLRRELGAARIRLAKLVAFDARAEGVLSQQLVSSYESDRPDIVSVVLEAHGFRDLLERIAFAQRIRKQNVRIVAAVRLARRLVAAEATRLGKLEVRQQTLTTQVLGQRNSLARTRLSLVQQQISVAQIRSQKAGQLANARGQLSGLRQQLSKLQAAQAAQANQASASAAASPSGSSSPSPAPSQAPGRGGFTFPLPKSAASPPGTWSLDQGVDISAPGGTPEYAVCSGTIVLHGIGGFGPDAPVLHCDSPVGGYDYVYYGHAGPANQLPVGTHVGAGQVMSEIGPGIVGISTGPHLEIGFSDASGTPVGSGSASQMMSLLQGSY